MLPCMLGGQEPTEELVTQSRVLTMPKKRSRSTPVLGNWDAGARGLAWTL